MKKQNRKNKFLVLDQKTFDLKEWLPWMYKDKMCIACKSCEETMNHFMICSSYENEALVDWKDINKNNYSKIIEIGKIVKKRHIERKQLLAGQATSTDSIAPGFTADGHC